MLVICVGILLNMSDKTAYRINTKLYSNPIRQLGTINDMIDLTLRADKITEADKKFLRTENIKVVTSWESKFDFKEETFNTDGSKKSDGLRTAQIGALHAIIAHWKVSDEPATIVLPTGVGKTETMLAALTQQQIARLLVVVPTLALREQLTKKFLGLGILYKNGLLKGNIKPPVVGTLEHGFKSEEQVEEFFNSCNVVIANIDSLNGCSEQVQRKIAEKCTHLFIDEAHHIPAPSWKKFRALFIGKPILQFTATPFRNDGRLIDGKIIFNYPLRLAQKKGYFKKITYDPVFEYNSRKSDEAIAVKAVKQLKKDLKKNFDHILMARVSSVKRADEVFKYYKKYAEYNPVQIHTGIKTKKEREEINRKILNKESRIIVCVDMLGEGFDLPELKIAAFHDIRKSLPITLQLVGRFTRTREDDLGTPTFIANAANVDVSEELRALYAQDSDWNSLLSQSSEKSTQEQVDLWEFIEGFDKFPEEIPLQNIQPAMSTVVYKSLGSTWKPEKWEDGFKGVKLDIVKSDINHKNNTLIIVVGKKSAVEWAQIKDITNWNWELYVVYWDQAQKLLFINASNNVGYFQKLAEAVTVGAPELVREVPVFRSLSGINRLKLQNVGLIEKLGRLIRYTMKSGPDVEAGLTPTELRTVKKANMFGVGYSGGEKTSIGCSYKGRIWSKKKANIRQLTTWCSSIGEKLLDEKINPDEVLKGTLVPNFIEERPNKVPIFIDWPEVMYMEPESIFEINIDGKHHIPLHEASIILLNPKETGDIEFSVGDDTAKLTFRLEFTKMDGASSYNYRIINKSRGELKKRSMTQSILEYFNENPPVVWFADGSSLEGNSYTELKWEYPPYDSNKIAVWDWKGTNIQKESQGLTQEKDSIQYKVIDTLKKGAYQIIFDDDGSGEIADVIAIKENEDSLDIDFYHCKYSKEPTQGARIEDLYEVCGQAQKSIGWLERREEILKHLQRRDTHRYAKTRVRRFAVGDNNLLLKFINKMQIQPTNIRVHIVQPGLSKGKVSNEQLRLLSVTENYLLETYKIPFDVIGNS